MKNVINKNTILALMVIGMMCFWGSMNANAQQLNVQGDLVSSYVWRGMYQTGASIQPTLGFSVGNFSLTAWGSTDFDGTSGFGRSCRQGDRSDGCIHIRSFRFDRIGCRLVVGRTGST